MSPEYKKTVERVFQLFRTCPDPNRKESVEGWSVKEILGHLVDSVSNNHQRLSRYIPKGNLSFPGYDQELCVQRARYQAFDLDQLLALWYKLQQTAAAHDRRHPRCGSGFHHRHRRQASGRDSAVDPGLFRSHGKPRTSGAENYCRLKTALGLRSGFSHICRQKHDARKAPVKAQ